MAQKTSPLLPATEDYLHRFGERLRLARLRRRLTSKQVAERAGMAPMTLRSLERGGSGVTIGAYLAVMQVLGIERDLDLLGQADPLGRELQDAGLSAGRGRRGEAGRHVDALARSLRPSVKPAGESLAWVDESGFTSSRVLADLIKVTAPASKKQRG